MKKRIILWLTVLALVISAGVYLTSKSPVTVVKATSILDFDDSLSTIYEMGSDTSVNYEMDEKNRKQDVNVLYKFTVESDVGYKIHVGGISDDNDTYININVIDAELNEYASFSTCDWDSENEKVSYQTEADFEVELLGGKIYYVLLTCVSHEYKDAYSGSYDFCMTEIKNLEIGTLPEDTTSLNVSTDQTVYKKISVNKTGWYELDACFNEEIETDENGVQLDLQDKDGKLLIINDGKCYLEAGMEYNMMLRMTGDETGRTETVNVKFCNVGENIISKEKECVYVNHSSCEFTADETEQVIVYSCSESADPKITIVKEGEEITGNEDYSWGESENEKDFGVVCSVEKGQAYTFLMDDNEESGEEVKVYLKTWQDSDEVEPETSPMATTSPVTPSDVSQNPTETLMPNVSGGTALGATSSQGTTQNVQPQTTATPESAVSKTVALGKVTSLKLTAKKKAIQASWKKVSGASGYELWYSTSKKFAKKKNKTAKKTKLTIKNLKQKKVYFVKVRAYTVKNGKKVYGAWSKTVKKKVK